MFLLNADVKNLLIGFWVGLIFSILLFIMFCALVRYVIVLKDSNKRKMLILAVPFVLGLLFFVGKIPYSEYHLLYNYHWVEGTTVGFCSSSGSSRSIEFEYHINNKKYKNCNRADDINKIRVNNGRYKVRVSSAVPENGQIDFNQPLIR